MSDRAYRTEAWGIAGIVFAATASKARWACVRGARSAGYSTAFSDVSVRRAPEYDGATMDDGTPLFPGRCYMPDCLRPAEAE